LESEIDMKNVYAHTGTTPSYPSYVSVNAKDGDDLGVTVRGPAVLVETESGSHFTAGHHSETILSKEHAMDLARSIFKHYGEDARSPFGYPLARTGEDGIGEAARSHFFPDDSKIAYEETDRVGEVSHTRRLIIDSMHDPLSAQVTRLAEFILKTFEGEPSENAGAVDTAIRLLGDYAAVQKARKSIEENRAAESRNLIATGLRAGQAHHLDGETALVTRSASFVNAGTTAAPAPDQFDDIAAELAGRVDGGNEPAVVSAPLVARYYPDERGYDVVSPQPYDDKV
jgi:hypothetical protein